MAIYHSDDEAFCDVTPEIARNALTALLGDNEFRVSERNRRFLAFVVSETLAGRANRIKAYSIAVDVFGRKDDFDAGSDPIVRIEATRLRNALASYYQNAGIGAPIQIVIPPGSYVPEFKAVAGIPRRTTSIDLAGMPPSSAAAARTPRVTILIEHHAERDDPFGRRHGELLSAAIVSCLAGHHYRVVVVPPPERRAAARAINDLLDKPRAVFALDVSVFRLAAGRRYHWTVVDLETGEIKASEVIDREDHEEPTGRILDELASRAAKFVTTVLASGVA